MLCEKVLAQTEHPMVAQFASARNAQDGLDPQKIKCASTKRVHWICQQCPMPLPMIAFSAQQGVHIAHAEKRARATLHMQCPEVAPVWDHDRNERTPRDYLPRFKALVWWKVFDRLTWQQKVDVRTKHILRHDRQAVKAPILQCSMLGSC